MNLTNHFLIALPAMEDPNFARSVVLVCEHNKDGAFGLVINQPMQLTLDYVFEQTEIDAVSQTVKDLPLLNGGPLQRDRGFVLHKPQGEWRSTMKVTDDLGLTVSQDVLQAMARDAGPDNALVSLGCAGWGVGQLEEELSKTNAWLCCPAALEIIFKTPFSQRWEAAAALLGVNIHTLAGHTGHA